MNRSKVEYNTEAAEVRRLVWHPGNQYDPSGYYANIKLGNILHIVLVTACSEPNKELEGEII